MFRQYLEPAQNHCQVTIWMTWNIKAPANENHVRTRGETSYPANLILRKKIAESTHIGYIIPKILFKL